MRAKLQQIKQELRTRMHEPVEATGKWRKRVVLGDYQYHAVPGNLQQCVSAGAIIPKVPVENSSAPQTGGATPDSGIQRRAVMCLGEETWKRSTN
jgi:hypothetical protein